jgi:dTDP-4-amino-4,6-dideoxygalactose transaminase
MAKLVERGISTNVHYKPLPLMSAYRALGWDIKDFPNSYDYYQNLITLPLHTQLSDADVAYVCDALGTVVREMRGTRGAHAATVAHTTQG